MAKRNLNHSRGFLKKLVADILHDRSPPELGGNRMEIYREEGGKWHPFLPVHRSPWRRSAVLLHRAELFKNSILMEHCCSKEFR